jgi:hypothetical protein
VHAAGARTLDVGGTLAVRFESTEPASNKKFNDKKIYKAKWTPPSPGPTLDDF